LSNFKSFALFLWSTVHSLNVVYCNFTPDQSFWHIYNHKTLPYFDHNIRHMSQICFFGILTSLCYLLIHHMIFCPPVYVVKDAMESIDRTSSVHNLWRIQRCSCSVLLEAGGSQLVNKYVYQEGDGKGMTIDVCNLITRSSLRMRKRVCTKVIWGICRFRMG